MGSVGYPCLTYIEECTTVNRVKGLGQVDESHKQSLHDVVRSLHFSWICCAAKIISIVPWDGLKPHWDSGRISASGRRQFKMWARIFPATESREMPR